MLSIYGMKINTVKRKSKGKQQLANGESVVWEKIKHFLKPTKITIIVLLSFVAIYLFVTLVQIFALYTIASDIGYESASVFSNMLQQACIDTKPFECDIESLQTEYYSSLSYTESDVMKAKENIKNIQFLKSVVFPAEQYLELSGTTVTYQFGNLSFLTDFQITSLLVAQVLVMIGYWYLIASIVSRAMMIKQSEKA